MRRWLRRLLLVVFAAAVLLLGAAAWLLYTRSGLEFALQRLQSTLPPDSLSWSAVDGRLAGPLSLRDLRYRQPGLVLHSPAVELDWSPLQLWRGEVGDLRVQLDALTLQTLPTDAVEPEPPLRLHWQWPDLALPLSIDLEALQLGPLRLDDQLVLESLQVAGHWSSGGEIALQRVQADAAQGRLQLQQTAVVAGEALALRWRFEGVDAPPLQGRLGLGEDGLSLSAEDAAQSIKLDVEVQAPDRWQLQAVLQQADLRPWWQDAPPAVQAQLGGEGNGLRGALEGALGSGPWPIDAFQLELEHGGAWQRWQLHQARLRPRAGGLIEASGKVDLAADSVDLQVEVDGVPLPAAEGQAVTRVERATLDVSGTLETLRASLRGQLSRAGKAVELQAQVLRSAEMLQIEQLELRGEAGMLTAQGHCRCEQEPLTLQLQVQSEGFDPAWLGAPESGRLDAKAELELLRQESSWQGALTLQSLSGEWRGRPVSGSGQLEWTSAEQLGGELQLQLGDSRLRASADAAGGPIEITLQPLHLDDLSGQAQGIVRGELQLDPGRDPIALQADLELRDLLWQGVAIGSANLQAQLGGAAGDDSLNLRWSDATLADLSEVQGEFSLRGALDDYRARLRLNNPQMQLNADWSGEHSAASKRIEELSLIVQGERFGEWTLQPGGPIRYGERLQLDPRCLQSEQTAICIEAGLVEGRRQFDLRLRDLPLQRLLAVTSARDFYRIEGRIQGSLRLIDSDAGWRVEQAELRGGEGRVYELSAEPSVLMAWTDLQLLAPRQGDQLQVDAAVQLDDGGHLRLDADLPWIAQPDWRAARGRLQVDVRELHPLRLLAPDLVSPTGQLGGELRFQEGAVDGQIELRGFGGSIPALGITLRQSELALLSRDGQLQVDGLIDSGEGPLRIEGDISLGDSPSARLRLAGDQVRVADTRRLKLQLSPKLNVQVSAEQIRVRGEITVPSARIDLERFEAGVTRSPDVVVLDPVEPPAGAGLPPVDALVKVVLGDAVELSGFGFDGGISGTLQVREQPGRQTVGRGGLDLRGSYQAYGQNLEITRGRLLFAASPLDNPGIDLRAKREVREVTVGIQVRGAARRPQLSLWSEPPLDQAEALSYLVLGQPLRSASATDGAQLGQAAAAIGGNLLASKVGGRLGFDTFGVAESTSLGGAAFTVGKYLSPRLYLSYGVALFDSAKAVTLRYLINEHLDVEIESARESRVGLNYKLETD